MLTFCAQPSAIAQVLQGILRPTVRTTRIQRKKHLLDNSIIPSHAPFTRQSQRAPQGSGLSRHNQSVWSFGQLLIIHRGQSCSLRKGPWEVLKCSLGLSIRVISERCVCEHSYHSDLKEGLKTSWAHSTQSLLWWVTVGGGDYPGDTERPGSQDQPACTQSMCCHPASSILQLMTQDSSSIFRLLIFIFREGWRCGGAVEIYTEMRGSRWSADEGEMKAMGPQEM